MRCQRSNGRSFGHLVRADTRVRPYWRFDSAELVAGRAAPHAPAVAPIGHARLFSSLLARHHELRHGAVEAVGLLNHGVVAGLFEDE